MRYPLTLGTLTGALIALLFDSIPYGLILLPVGFCADRMLQKQGVI